MNILVLMAGKGQRFVNEGYTVPKPLIQVNGKTILEWTTESCPYIKHGEESQNSNINLYFAVLREHLNDGIDKFLFKTYGSNITIIPFDSVTSGSLETALRVAERMWNKLDSLLVLDADNKYNNNDLEQFIREIGFKKNTGAVACWDNSDKSLPNKWSNVIIDNGLAVNIKEKDDSWVDHPTLIGIFYFTETDFFIKTARYVLKNLDAVSFNGSNEYYMSMVPMYMINQKLPVYVHKVTDVVPLGTPRDLELFKGVV